MAKLTAVALLLALSTTQLAAQQQQLLNSNQVLDKYRDSIGAERWSTVKTIHTRGTWLWPGLPYRGTIETFQARPNKSLTIKTWQAKRSFSKREGEAKKPDGIGVTFFGFDGHIAWTNHRVANEKERYNSDMLNLGEGPRILKGIIQAQTAAEAVFDDLIYPPKLFEKVETVDRVEFEGHTCWKLNIVQKPFVSDAPNVSDAKKTLAARTSYHFFAVDSGLLLGREMMKASLERDGSEVLVPTKFVMTEYKQFDGVKMPTRIVMSQKGFTRYQAELSVVALNDMTIMERFELPAEVKVLVGKASEAQKR